MSKPSQRKVSAFSRGRYGIMKSFFGTIAIIGLVLAGGDGDLNAVYKVNTLAVACFLGGVVGLLMTIRKEE